VLRLSSFIADITVNAGKVAFCGNGEIDYLGPFRFSVVQTLSKPTLLGKFSEEKVREADDLVLAASIVRQYGAQNITAFSFRGINDTMKAKIFGRSKKAYSSC
jgi:hypothetical protein